MAIAPNSSVLGFLQSVTVVPMDDALENSLNPTIAQITGLDPDSEVRPRWQPDPPTQPDRNTDWVAFGVNRSLSENWASVTQNDGLSASVIRYQQVEILLSWYGPNAGRNAEVFRDGLQIGQNRDLLNASDFGIVDIGESRRAPELFKEKYLNRYDQTLVLRRRTERVFSILTLQGFGLTLSTDPRGETPLNIHYS